MPEIEQLPVDKVTTSKDGSAEQPFVPDVHDKLLGDVLQPPAGSTLDDTRASAGQKPDRLDTNQALSEALLAKGIMPALDKKDIPDALAQAAAAMNNKDIGVPSDGNKSSGTSVSRLLKAVGADINQTGLIPDLKNQLEKAGWESMPLGSTALKPGDLVFTSMDPNGRNVGVVGENGKIYSHNFGSHSFQGRNNWSSKFVTVMRQKD